MLPQAAAIYARISSDPDATRAGVERQLKDCHEWAGRRGWVVVDEYIDNDTSAYSGKRRPEYERMLEDLVDGRRDGVVVYHLDRLHRRPRELEDFVDACDRAGVRALACVTGEVDLATHDGRFHARILGAVARKESDDKSRRLTRKHREIAEAGRFSGGGTRAYGYADDRVTLVPHEAEVIKEMADRFLAGDSLRSIATDLNERGIRSATGREWSTHTVRQLIHGSRISGQREHHGEIQGKAVWPAIIRPAQTARIRARLDDPDRRTNRVSRRYLLAGVLRCAACGTPLVARPREDGQRRYVCARAPGRPGCGRTFILAEEVEAFIAEGVLHRLSSRRLAAAVSSRTHSDPAAAKLLSALERDQEQLDELATAYGRKEVSFREWQAARAPIQERIKTANATLSRQQGTTALRGVVDHPDGPRVGYERLPLARQQAVVKAVLDHADVGPAVRGRNRFDPSRVLPAWRA
jgi:site-specific DNA recombinase